MSDIFEVARKLNPLDNSVQFDSFSLKWVVDPKLVVDGNFPDINIENSITKSIKESILHLELKEEFFKDKNPVEIKVTIDGKIEAFTFQPGVSPVAFDFALKQSIKASDITIKMNIKGNTSIFTSKPNSDNFKATFLLTKKL